MADHSGPEDPSPRSLSLGALNSTADRSSFLVLKNHALLPIRPGECADDPACRADHARAERGHRHVVMKAVDVHNRLVEAEIADDPQRAHTQRPTTPGVVEVAVNEVLSPKKPAQQVPADTQ